MWKRVLENVSKHARNINWLTSLVTVVGVLAAIISAINPLLENVASLLGVAETDIERLMMPLLLFITTLLVRGFAQLQQSVEQGKKLTGIESFHPSRKHAGPFVEHVERAQKNVMVIGVGLGVAFSTDKYHTYRELIKRGITIRFLFLSPYIKTGEINPMVEAADRLTDISNNREEILVRLGQLRDFRSSLEDEAALQIRGYDMLPTTTAILIDTDQPHGRIHVEAIIPEMPAPNRPSFETSQVASPELYVELRKYYEKLWNEAIDIDKILEWHRGASTASLVEPPDAQERLSSSHTTS